MQVSSIGGSDGTQRKRKLAAQAAMEPRGVNESQSRGAAAAYERKPNGRSEVQRVVFLVEDNIADVFLIQRAIELYGLSVRLIVAEDGEKAIQFLSALDDDPEARPPDVVLLDLNLPRRSGADVLQAFRTSRRCRNVPVIVVTSSDSQEDRDRAVQLGASAYFRKPNAYREFLQIGQLMKDCLARTEPS
jgi:CheY-like chemotaxis protein